MSDKIGKLFIVSCWEGILSFALALKLFLYVLIHYVSDQYIYFITLWFFNILEKLQMSTPHLCKIQEHTKMNGSPSPLQEKVLSLIDMQCKYI